jgi:hypothetical protein
MTGSVFTWQLAVKLALLAFFLLRSGHFDTYLEPMLRPIHQFSRLLMGSANVNNHTVSKLSRHASSATLPFSLSQADEDIIRRQALTLLRQQRQVLGMLESEHYTKRVPSIFDSSVASHVRHILDHYQTILTAAAASTETLANYDERSRDTDVERNMVVALSTIERMEQEILSINLQKPVKVAFYGDTETFQVFKVPSSVGREIAFASHHAIHHMSMVKLLMQSMNYDFPADATIGIAPSTAKDMRKKHLEEFADL